MQFCLHWQQQQSLAVLHTLDEICTYCSSYYASLEQMVADYGFRGALQIMAECIFEQLGFDDMEFNAEQKSEGAAIKFIHEWMKG